MALAGLVSNKLNVKLDCSAKLIVVARHFDWLCLELRGDCRLTTVFECRSKTSNYTTAQDNNKSKGLLNDIFTEVTTCIRCLDCLSRYL